MYVETRQGRQPIQRLDASVAAEVLGVFMAPDGNSKAMKKAMRGKAENWADRVRSGHVRVDEAWDILQATLTKSLQYPLTATTLTEKDCSYIEAPALRQGLKSAGFPSNLPRAIVMAPDQYVGLRHGSLYHTQHQRQLIVLQTYGKSSCLTGSLIRQTIERHKVETGLFHDLFAQPIEVLSDCVTHTWISSAWRYMRRFHLHVKESTASLSPRREGDAAIMARLIEAGYRGKQLAVLNRCRLYLRVATLADILDGHGTSLLPGVLDAKPTTKHPSFIRRKIP